MTAPRQLTIRKPDDFHVHLRDQAMLSLTVNHSAKRFARVGVMPNLMPPITTAAMAMDYRARILSALTLECNFDPLMVLFLKRDTALSDIQIAAKSEHFLGVKYYPSGVTTNSVSSINSLEDVYSILEYMEEHQLPLLLHGECAAPDVDVFDREQRFLAEQVEPVLRRFPKLRLVLEHITTTDAVDFVQANQEQVGATITAHHLMYNRNDMLGDGIKPHLYCKPILKRRRHQEALRNAATSAQACFFLGSDSAPHARNDKECSSGCAGCYTAHAGIELYAEVFAEEQALDKLEAFSSINGATFYGLSLNEQRITLIETQWQSELEYHIGERSVVPLRAGLPIRWRLG